MMKYMVDNTTKIFLKMELNLERLLEGEHFLKWTLCGGTIFQRILLDKNWGNINKVKEKNENINK